MSQETSLAATTVQDGASPDVQIERVSAPMFSRVQEPEGSDGATYDIEILAQDPGAMY